MPDIRVATVETPIGRLWLGGSAHGLRWIRRDEHPDPQDAAADPEPLADALAQLAAYFAGTRRSFDLLLDLSGVGPFDAAVWAATASIPYGSAVSYGDVAAAIGRPRSARAVGGAMARCPLAPVIPCHRVIRADGSLGGWGRDGWVKRWLLDHEGWRQQSSVG